MYKIDEEEMILCPYNRYHLVKKIRIQNHILKCKKNYPEINLVSCIYNYSHRLKPEDILEHYEICRHKVRLDGARYCEPDDFTRVSSVKSEQQTTTFPDINCRARVLPEPEMLAEIDFSDSQQLDSSLRSSDSDMPELENDLVGQFYDRISLKNDDDDLKPLPLPKTVSKAFVCMQKQQDKSESTEPLYPKGLGRGGNFRLSSPSKSSQKSDSLPPLVSTVPYESNIKRTHSYFSLGDDEISYNKSVGSLMLEDTSTLKSMDCTQWSEMSDSCFLKDLDKYVKK